MGGGGDFVAWFVTVGGVLAVVGFFYSVFAANSKQRAQLEALASSGFSFDHTLSGSIIVVFDDKQRRVAFVGSDQALQFNYGDITRWNWKWVERNGSQIKNKIQFFIRDAAHPLIETSVGRRDAELWLAKIEAIING